MYKKFKILSTLLMNMLCFSLFAQHQTDTLILFFDPEKSVVDNNTELLNKLTANEKIISISIYGYTDFLGSVAYNQKLSEKRSTNLYNYPLDKEIIIFSKKNKAHLIVQVVYTKKSQDLSEEDFVPNNYIVLENILFYVSSLQFRPESYPDLEKLFEIMQKFHTLKIEIQGHVCCNHEINAGLLASIGRAKAVYDFLVEKGIDSSRMIYKGFGSTRKRYPLERDENEKAMNRRVEILILEK